MVLTQLSCTIPHKLVHVVDGKHLIRLTIHIPFQVSQPCLNVFRSVAGSKPAPEEFDNEVMDMLKRHAINESHELRTGWPDLK